MNTTNIVDGEDDENSLTFFWAQTKKSTAKTKPKYNHLMRTDENVKIIIYNIYMIWITSICQFQILQWSKQAPHPTPLMKATNQTVGFTVEAIHVWPAGGGRLCRHMIGSRHVRMMQIDIIFPTMDAIWLVLS